MTHRKQLLGAVSAFALIAFTSSPVLAAGTAAGSSITNNVSVSFDVGGVTQTAVTDDDTFTVDRRVDVTVAEVGGAATSVAPGSTAQATTFQVTNLSNDTVDFNLSLVQSATDDFDIVSPVFYLDDGDGVFDAGDTIVTYLDEIAADASVVVHVVGNIPITATNGQTADVTLVADAHAGGSASALGTELTATAGANTAGVDTVLADAAASGDDGANQGDHADTDSYVVAGAVVTVSKTSSIIEDPVNGTTNPKAIPGATIQYCITVSNASGAATATDVAVNDVLPADVSYLAAFGIFVDGDASCASGVAGGTYDGGTHEIDASLSDIAATETRSVYFRVTID
ncbi:hypothetical protein [Parerythrobacter lacustris]|uniref:DUF11 domain-containing protein n=1 Tax=Parerythrobacter lacustris TaxID=2969984 RepID=A0ABT1XMR1_9SPHN|nr:hypothetical protein [Parerythrobacter lacustris]MCR2832948.1 hypothetical protein [Parerythrobacter lacustris]